MKIVGGFLVMNILLKIIGCFSLLCIGHIAAMDRHPDQDRIDAFPHNHPNAPLLIKAAVAGDANQIAFLLKEGNEEVDIKYPNDVTPLKWAAAYGHQEVCSLLVAHKANINHMNPINKSPYFSDRTPLMHAAEMKQNNICTWLIRNSADVFIQSATGWYALDSATNQHAMSTSILLLDAMLKPTKEQKHQAYFVLACLNKKHPRAKDTNRLIVRNLLYNFEQRNKSKVIEITNKVCGGLEFKEELIKYIENK